MRGELTRRERHLVGFSRSLDRSKAQLTETMDTGLSGCAKALNHCCKVTENQGCRVAIRRPLTSDKRLDAAGPQGIARRHELSLNERMKLGFLILLLSVSVAASKEIPNESLTLTWDANRISDKVTGYRVYELVKSRRFLIGQSKTAHFVIPRKKGKHVYVVTAVSNTKISRIRITV
jgi:hypothetical protein